MVRDIWVKGKDAYRNTCYVNIRTGSKLKIETYKMSIYVCCNDIVIKTITTEEPVKMDKAINKTELHIKKLIKETGGIIKNKI